MVIFIRLPPASTIFTYNTVPDKKIVHARQRPKKRFMHGNQTKRTSMHGDETRKNKMHAPNRKGVMHKKRFRHDNQCIYQYTRYIYAWQQDEQAQEQEQATHKQASASKTQGKNKQD